MGARSDKEGSEEKISQYGPKKYDKLVRMLKEGYISLCIYKNVHSNKVFYDIVIYRKVKINGSFEYRRGTNFKPSDIQDLMVLLSEAKSFLESNV